MTYKVIIARAWYGTLGMLSTPQQLSITLLDKDDSCKKFIDNVVYDTQRNVCFLLQLICSHNYTEDIIINTSCEHIGNVRDWLIYTHGKIGATIQTII